MGKTLITALTFLSLFGCKTPDVETYCPDSHSRKMDIQAERISKYPEKIEMTKILPDSVNLNQSNPKATKEKSKRLTYN